MESCLTRWVAMVLAGAGVACSQGAAVGTSVPDSSVDAPHRKDSAPPRDTGTPKHDAGHDASEAGCPLVAPCNACLATDPKNCGACGHSCGAKGSCAAGKCTETLAEGQGTAPNVVIDIIVDATSVYWIPATEMSAGKIVSVPKGGGTTTTLASGILQPQGLTEDANNLYFVSHNFGIQSLPKSGGTRTTILRDGLLDAGLYPEYWLALASPDLFYVGGLGINVYELVLDGGTVPAQITSTASLLGSPGNGYNALAVDDGGIYYDTTSQIVTLARATNAITSTLSGSYGPTLAIDDAFVYFTSSSDGGSNTSLMRAPKGGASPTVVSSTDVGSDDGPIAVDATNVYWSHLPDAATQAGVIVSTPKAGGVVTTVATGCYGHCAFALDDTQIYWPGADGTIRAAAISP